MTPTDNGTLQEPANAVDLRSLGLEHVQRGMYARAIELLGRAVAMRPSIAAYHIDLGEAYRLLGDFKHAAACCRIALRLAPDYPEGLNTLGLIFHGEGRYAEAVEEFRRALALRPQMAEAHNNLGVALQELGRIEEAIVHFRHATELSPEMFRARTNLGLALLNQGRAAEALPCFLEAVRIEPTLAILHQNLGNALRILEQYVDARAAYLEAIRLDPRLGLSHLYIGMTLRREDQANDALPWLKMAVELDPNNAFAWEQLADLHGELEEPGDAIPCWQRVLALSPTERAVTHNSLGWSLHEEGRILEAKEHYLIAQRLQPEMATVQLNLGTVQEELGDMAAAEASFRTALRLQPNFALPHTRLATLLRDKLPDADLAALQQRLADPQLGPAPGARLLFGLAHVLDARGEYARAADCLRRSNAMTHALARGTREYVPADHELFVNNLVRVFDATFFGRMTGAGLETRRPLFIFGLPRSGTTLVEQVLSSHPRVHGAGELRLARRSFEAIPSALQRSGPPIECVPSLTEAAVRHLAEQHLDNLAAFDGGKADRIVDKMPDNYLYIGLLATLFPNAVFIHCRRDLRDVAVSCWMTDFRSIRWASSVEHIASRFQRYRRLMDHWQEVLPVTINVVNYEETVADLEAVARRLLAACGLDWDPACLEFYRTQRTVRTASLTQVRQPIYTKSVARWKKYEPALSELFQLLPLEVEVPV